MAAQLIFIAFVLVITLLLWRARETAHGRAWKRILLVAFAGFVIWTILYPDAATNVANALGIGRGTDLITYLTAFSLMFLAVLVYLKFARLEGRVAAVTRELALSEWERVQLVRASQPPPEGRAGAGPTG